MLLVALCWGRPELCCLGVSGSITASEFQQKDLHTVLPLHTEQLLSALQKILLHTVTSINFGFLTKKQTSTKKTNLTVLLNIRSIYMPDSSLTATAHLTLYSGSRVLRYLHHVTAGLHMHCLQGWCHEDAQA